MGKSKADAKPVEWKDTFEFKCFPQYEYTSLQKSRFILFQCRAKQYRKFINYADRFEDNSKIVLIYMLGYNKNLKSYVEKTKHNVVILCAKIPDDVLAGYDRYWELMEKLKTAGYVHDDVIIQSYYDYRRKVYDYYGVDSDDPFVIKYRQEQEIIESYPEIVKQINACYKRYTIIDKLHPEKTIDHKDINKIIKRYFPFGREECGVPHNTKNTASVIQKAIDAGFARVDPVTALHIPNDEKYIKLVFQNIKRCIMNINVDLRDDDMCDMEDVWESMTHSPYGWQKSDAHACYCFSYALSEFLGDEYYMFDSLMSWRAVDSLRVLCEHLMIANAAIRRRSRFQSILFINTGWHLMNRLACIFDMEPDDNLVEMIQKLREKIRQYTRFPIALLDERLNEILVPESAWALFDPGYIKPLEKYFDWDRCNELKERYQTFNEDTWAWIRNTYRNMYDDEIITACTTTDSGWLWTKEMFVETLTVHNIMPPWTEIYFDYYVDSYSRTSNYYALITRIQREIRQNRQIKGEF